MIKDNTYDGEPIYRKTPPKNMVSLDEASKILGITKANTGIAMRRRGYNGTLYAFGETLHHRRFFKRADVEKVWEVLRQKHELKSPLIAFNKNVSNGRIMHFKNISACRHYLKVRYKVDLPIRCFYELISSGESYNGWFIDEDV